MAVEDQTSKNFQFPDQTRLDDLKEWFGLELSVYRVTWFSASQIIIRPGIVILLRMEPKWKYSRKIQT